MAGSATHDVGAVARVPQRAQRPLHNVPQPPRARGPRLQLERGGGPQQDLAQQAGLCAGQGMSDTGGRGSMICDMIYSILISASRVSRKVEEI